MNNTLHLVAAAVAAAFTSLAHAGPVAVTGDHHGFGTALAVGASAFDRNADPDIDDATTVPHASLVAGAAGPFDYYRIDVGSSGALTLDIDYSDGFDHAGLGLDLQLAVWTLGGTLLATDDDDPRDWGFPGPSADNGSASILDPWLHLDGLSAGSYVVGVAYAGAQADAGGWLAGGEIPAGGMYVLQVSTDAGVSAVPEPGSAMLWLAGLLGLASASRRRSA
jgi:MYXO-CTERM domain-containing protein